MKSNGVLMEHLQRIENNVGHLPKANEVIRDTEAPHANTYYTRFGWSWPDVMGVYETWKETGELPEEPDPYKWQRIAKSGKT